MKHLFRLWTLLLLAGGLWLTTSSCSDDKKDDPAPTTGGLSGNVVPANALTQVTATNSGGLTFLAAPNTSTGAFSLNDLAPGTYTLSFTPASGFLTPAPRSITIAAGAVAAAGTVSVSNVPQGTLTGTITPADGVTKVEAISSTGAVVSAVPNASTGAFSLTGLALDTYSVRFTEAPGYYPVQDLSATLTTTSPTENLGSVYVQSDGRPRGTMSWTVNGTTYTSTLLNGSVNGGSFELSGMSTTGATTDQVEFGSLLSGQGTGTYPMGSAAGATYIRTVNGSTTTRYETSNSGSSGAVVVSTFIRSGNTTTVGGTFSFVAQSATGTISVANGTFNVRY